MRQKIVFTGNLEDGGVKYLAQRLALRNKLTGVSYRGPEKSITVEAQGDPENIDKLISEIKKGNQFFSVDNVEVEEIPEVEERTFRIG